LRHACQVISISELREGDSIDSFSVDLEVPQAIAIITQIKKKVDFACLIATNVAQERLSLAKFGESLKDAPIPFIQLSFLREHSPFLM
jgi:hypothetical protein